jgi:hypothetical protein
MILKNRDKVLNISFNTIVAERSKRIENTYLQNKEYPSDRGNVGTKTG